MPRIFTLPDGRQLSEGQQFTLNEVQYGSLWLAHATAEDLAALGITVRDEPEPDTQEPQVPEAVSMFQARAVLMQAGLYDTVDASLKQAGGVNLLAWEYATEVRRDSPLVLSMAQSLGLTPEQVDQLFIQAAQITT